jgi:hypothetical protein
MSDAPKNGNGNGRHRQSAAGVLSSLGERLIGALPPAFLLLVLLNCAFLGMAAWTFSHNTEVRNAMLTRIIDACLLERKEPAR